MLPCFIEWASMLMPNPCWWRSLAWYYQTCDQMLLALRTTAMVDARNLFQPTLPLQKLRCFNGLLMILRSRLIEPHELVVPIKPKASYHMTALFRDMMQKLS